MRWIWLDAIPHSLFDLYMYIDMLFFFNKISFIRSHTFFDTIKFPHFILFHFSTRAHRSIRIHMKEFRLNFLVCRLLCFTFTFSHSADYFTVFVMFSCKLFLFVVFLCRSNRVLPNSIAIRLKCRCELLKRLSYFFCSAYVFGCFSFNRPFCMEFVQV